jgi:geranylgeranyl diphosphate synthase, type I
MVSLSQTSTSSATKATKDLSQDADQAAIQQFAREQLSDFKIRLLEPRLAQYFAAKRGEYEQRYSKSGLELFDHIRDFVLRDGKRFRPALLYFAYKGLGGKDEEQAAHVSMAMELIHGFLLIHDDVIDEDDLRRGKPSMHKMYEDIFDQRFIRNIPEYRRGVGKHFGESIALVAGDILETLAYDVLLHADLPAETVRRLMIELNNTVNSVGFGEMIEFYKSFEDKLSKREILNIYDLKTAQYTFRCPIVMGAIMAGTNKQVISKFEAFSWNLGVAFQLQDDIIGMFATEAEIGKPIGSDIQEGKETLLVWYARLHATPSQKALLEEALGNPHLTEHTIVDMQRMMIEVGAKAYCEEKASLLKDRALHAIADVELTKECRDFLHGLAEYTVSRSK